MTAIASFIRAILLTIRRWFFRFIPAQSFLYMACGVLNLAFDMEIFFVAYHYIFVAQNFKTPFFTFSPHIASLILAFLISTPTGFFLSKYVVWTNSIVKGRRQVINYLSVVALCVAMNVGFLKFFVEILHFYPLPSRLITSVIVVATSYYLQRIYAFKVHKAAETI